jgi:iron-sulfur cluster insertion protein
MSTSTQTSQTSAQTQRPTAEQDQNPILLTASAIAKVQKLITEEGNPNLKLRIYIVGGGCSGFQYGFKFDENLNEDDIVIPAGPITAVVDALSVQYLMGAQVDYLEGLQGSRFAVSNPNAETTCGCGSSFALKEDNLTE